MKQIQKLKKCSQVAEVASTKRAIPPKGNVTYHEFGRLGYGHIGITTDPNILQYIKYA